MKPWRSGVFEGVEPELDDVGVFTRVVFLEGGREGAMGVSGPSEVLGLDVIEDGEDGFAGEDDVAELVEAGGGVRVVLGEDGYVHARFAERLFDGLEHVVPVVDVSKKGWKPFFRSL
jgi:hypothetical protein